MRDKGKRAEITSSKPSILVLAGSHAQPVSRLDDFLVVFRVQLLESPELVQDIQGEAVVWHSLIVAGSLVFAHAQNIAKTGSCLPVPE
jgi:hypothetical protein